MHTCMSAYILNHPKTHISYITSNPHAVRATTGFQGPVPVPWYAVLIVDLLQLVALALVTLPLHTLVAHTARLNELSTVQ